MEAEKMIKKCKSCAFCHSSSWMGYPCSGCFSEPLKRRMVGTVIYDPIAQDIAHLFTGDNYFPRKDVGFGGKMPPLVQR